MSKDLNHQKIADAFDAIAEQLLVIVGAFRASTDGGAKSGGDASARKQVRGKPAPAPVDNDDDAVSEDAVRAALKELSASKGKDAMVAVLAKFGAGRLSDVDESQYGELMEAITEASEEEAKPAAKGRKPAAKKAPAKKEPEIDIDELGAKFKELVEADRAAAKKVLKDAGLAKLAELDTDDADAVKELWDAISEALGTDEDDDLVG